MTESDRLIQDIKHMLDKLPEGPGQVDAMRWADELERDYSFSFSREEIIATVIQVAKAAGRSCVVWGKASQLTSPYL
jgi:hypothetical protein